MLFKSQVFTQASGSVGGLTYAHNRSGMYTRGRAIPTNPGTEFQQAVRNFMGQLTSAWLSTLTPAQRTGWETYDDNVTMMNPLGDPIHIGALQHFVRSNLPRLQAEVTQINDAPIIFNLGTMTEPEFTATADDDMVGVAFTDTDAWANEDDAHLLVSASRPLSPTINYFKGPYRFIGTVDGDSITPPTSPTELASAFPLDADQLVYAMVRASRADGRLSSPFRGSAVVTAS